MDCKEEACKKINADAPKMLDYLCPECNEHFEDLKRCLTLSGVHYEINPRIVRGLDYYTRSVFEFVSPEIKKVEGSDIVSKNVGNLRITTLERYDGEQCLKIYPQFDNSWLGTVDYPFGDVVSNRFCFDDGSYLYVTTSGRLKYHDKYGDTTTLV